MNEQEKAALRARFAVMSVDEKLTEIATCVFDPDRAACRRLVDVNSVLRGNGKAGLVTQVRNLRWAVIVLAGAMLVTPAMPSVWHKLVMLLVGGR